MAELIADRLTVLCFRADGADRLDLAFFQKLEEPASAARMRLRESTPALSRWDLALRQASQDRHFSFAPFMASLFRKRL